MCNQSVEFIRRISGAQVQELLQATAAMPSAAGELPDFLQPYGRPEEALVLIDQD